MDRRGRPRAFSEEELGSPGLSRRQRQNHAYAERGRLRLSHLWGEECEAPLCVLAELGRVREEAKFREAAWWYRFRARDLTARQTVTRLRQLRTGKTHQEGPGELYKCLTKTIKTFQVTHPDTSPEYVERELELALETVDHFRYCGW